MSTLQMKIRHSRFSRSDSKRHNKEQIHQRDIAHTLYVTVDEFVKNNPGVLDKNAVDKINALVKEPNYEDAAREIISLLKTPEGVQKLLSGLAKIPNADDDATMEDVPSTGTAPANAPNRDPVQPTQLSQEVLYRLAQFKLAADPNNPSQRAMAEGLVAATSPTDPMYATYVNILKSFDNRPDPAPETKQQTENKQNNAPKTRPKRKLTAAEIKEIDEEVAKEIKTICPECEYRLCKRGCDLCHDCDRKRREGPLKETYRELREIQKERERERKSRKDKIMAEKLLELAKKKLEEERKAEDDAFLTDASDPE